MTIFQELTGFIERLDSEEHGNWVIDKENDGTILLRMRGVNCTVLPYFAKSALKM